MSRSVRVIKKHAEYSSFKAFNWKSSDFYYLLRTLGCNIDDADAYGDEFEYCVKEYETALDFLKEYKEKGNCKEIREKVKNDFNTDMTTLDYYINELEGIDNVIKSMQYMYDERDKDYGYITFVVW